LLKNQGKIMSLRKALIIGIAGQDGYFLSRFLLSKGTYCVYGVGRSDALPPEIKQNIASIDIVDLQIPGRIGAVVRKIKPDEIYFLAAHHFSSQGNENCSGSLRPFLDVNLLAVDEILQVLSEEVKECRFFYAASSHIFGVTSVSPQTEETPLVPVSPYAISKASALFSCRYYRETCGLYTSVGILYNHESVRRRMSFITKQIANAAALASLGKPRKLMVRNLDAVVDWGAAEDFVHAMWLTLQQNRGDDYIVATGLLHSVHEFANTAFSFVRLRADDFVTQDASVLKRPNLFPLCGDISKIKRICGWEPHYTFEKMVELMVKNEINEFKYKIA
jgi:GDPmannose 4,6-dehydratase